MLKLDDSIISNETIIDLEKLTSAGLFCFTNTTACCQNTDTREMGSWHFPNGSQVPDSGSHFRQERGTSYLKLINSGYVTPPPGLYYCVVPDSNNTKVTTFIGAYDIEQGTQMHGCNTIIDLGPKKFAAD